MSGGKARRRLAALVIGNAAYSGGGKLKNPTNDADDVASRLDACGFLVIKLLDCTIKKMDAALKKFKSDLADHEVGLFFFAGHGMQIEGDNYLLAVDTDTSSELDAKHSSLSLNKVIDTMEKTGAATSIIILDACRNNPYERAWHRTIVARGLAPVYAPRGTLIAYATSPGQFASDGSGRNGAYTDALLKHIDTPDCSIETMFKRVRNTLSVATNQKQISWEHTSLSDEFFFNLSLGVRIDEYSETALNDALFVLDETRLSHRLIRDLKILTWSVQNRALADYTADKAEKASSDSLFVIGRNIYQAACGGSHAASAYLDTFMERTSGMSDAKRKALLDGMLFEVFFDSMAKLRKDFKLQCYQEVFHLQQHKELGSSFDFIAECLLPSVDKFYAIPGKRHQVVVDITTDWDHDANADRVMAVHCSGSSILWLEDDDLQPEPGEPIPYMKLRIGQFEEQLSRQIVVPPHLLTINYLNLDRQGTERIMFPYGHTVRKR